VKTGRALGVFVLPLAALLILSACAKPVRNAPLPPALLQQQPAVPKDLARLQASLSSWTALREQLPNGYRYKVIFKSFSGYRQVTTVTVKNQQVIERRLESQAPGPASTMQLQWVETGAGIGGHGNAAPPLTLDALYVRARQIAESPLKAHERLSLGFDERGLLQHCFIIDIRIADDAPQTGVPPLQLDLNPS
jgi:hypothetical protein